MSAKLSLYLFPLQNYSLSNATQRNGKKRGVPDSMVCGPAMNMPFLSLALDAFHFVFAVEGPNYQVNVHRSSAKVWICIMVCDSADSTISVFGEATNLCTDFRQVYCLLVPLKNYCDSLVRSVVFTFVTDKNPAGIYFGLSDFFSICIFSFRH